MEAIGELSTRLAHFFSWNKSRIDCLCKFIFAILIAQTVNLVSISNVFFGRSKSSSDYRRIQRFLRWLETFEEEAQNLLQNLVLSLLDRHGKRLRLAMDRTNWKFGVTHINLLVLGFWYRGVNIPLVWVSLGRAGNSKTSERITLIKRLLKGFKKSSIEVLTADREFVGEAWFRFLVEEEIPFVIRIKGDAQVRRCGCSHTIPSKLIFKRLRKGKRKILKDKHEVSGIFLFIAAARNKEGELLIVASNTCQRSALNEYLKRWGIECLFACLKKKGFNFEDTHMKEKSRISAIFFILVLVTAWCMRCGAHVSKKKH